MLTLHALEAALETLASSLGGRRVNEGMVSGYHQLLEQELDDDALDGVVRRALAEFDRMPSPRQLRQLCKRTTEHQPHVCPRCETTPGWTRVARGRCKGMLEPCSGRDDVRARRWHESKADSRWAAEPDAVPF